MSVAGSTQAESAPSGLETSELETFAGLRQLPVADEFQPASTRPIDLARFGSVDDLLREVGADQLKAELSRLGMKCGGTAQQRAERLYQAKGVSMSELAKSQPSLFAKPKRAEAPLPPAAAAAAAGSLFRPCLGPMLPGQERRVGQKSVRSTAAGMEALAQQTRRAAHGDDRLRPTMSAKAPFVAERFRPSLKE